jgi:hypothetical protein
MALNADQVERIQLEATLGLDPTLNSAEALRVRALLDQQIAEIILEGLIVDLALEWPTPARRRSS